MERDVKTERPKQINVGFTWHTETIGESSHPAYQMQDSSGYSVTNFPLNNIINLEDTLVDGQPTENCKNKKKEYTTPNTICNGTQDTDRCIYANQSTDGAIIYANDIHSIAKTNIGIRDIAAKSMKKFIPIRRTLK